MSTTICETLAGQLAAWYQCEAGEDHVRVRTPLRYPDGDVVDLYVREQGEGGVVSDLGESVAWLGMHTAAAKRSKKQTALIHDICATLGVRFYRGALLANYRDAADMAQAVSDVGQAALRVADIWFTFQHRSNESIVDAVAQMLKENEIDFTTGKKLPGRSSRGWPIDFHTRAGDVESLMLVASTGSRSNARRVSEHVTSAWHDLSHLVNGPQRPSAVTLVDDTADVWTEDELNLMDSLSHVEYWSRPEKVVQALKPAA